MDYNAMSPDNSMALFYAFLLLAETKFSEGNLTAGTYMFMDLFTQWFTPWLLAYNTIKGVKEIDYRDKPPPPHRPHPDSP